MKECKNDVSKHKLPDDQSFDLILSFDCVHDMADPQSVIDSIYKSLNVDGTWFVSDLKVADSFAENLKNPLAKYFYACSLVCCLPSACVGENCAKLGTLGFGPSTAKAMITKAGFRRFKMLDIDNPFNLYYEARP
ncbi:MAG: methyltransferase domain-containing protein [Gammaproteobacteria bacterium]|nr:methyltransferase domain-containing protein [Gammaproteobacteria bacterium]